MKVKINYLHLALVLSFVGLVVTSSQALAERYDCKYTLTSASSEPGMAKVKIDGQKLVIKVKNAHPDSLYTIWVDFKNRATGELASDYPLDKGALGRGVAPAFASTAGVTSGMGTDPNAIFTDEDGDATYKMKLNYRLLVTGDSPVVGSGLAMQGLNRVGGGWLRMYNSDPMKEASHQVVGTDGLPVLELATPQGLTIVRHPDTITHGHTPGVGGVDHVSGFKGDFPSECLS